MAQLFEAPRITGLTYVKKLGSGGFSNVYLYQQKFPKRLVAVKVLNSPVHQRSIRAQFIAEADTMAQLSNHPAMVTIYSADIAPDRHPYFVMEYCEKPSLAQRVASEGFTVAEVLRLGIRIASAVETAHQHQILHRDIKPANILTTDYGWPALTDFGLSSVQGQRPARDLMGLSIPWAPPEIIDNDNQASVQSDIYSLGATLYTILAGHHPFYVSAKDDSVMALMQRIETHEVPVLERADVPPELFELLVHSMAKRPVDRPNSAASFARALQRIEQGLSLSQTPLELPMVAVTRSESEHAQPTRQRALLTDQVPSAAEQSPVTTEPATKKSMRTYVIAAGLAVMIGSAAAMHFSGPAPDDHGVEHPGPIAMATGSARPDPIEEILYRYDDDGFVTFYWEASDDPEVNAYAWRVDPSDNHQRTHNSEVTVGFDGDAVCIDIAAVAKNGGMSDESRKCAPKQK